MDTSFRWIFFRPILPRIKPAQCVPVQTPCDRFIGDIMKMLIRILLFISSVTLGVILVIVLMFLALLAYCALSPPQHFH